MPAFLNLRRLEGRIVALFLGLLLLVQLVSLVVTRSAVTGNAEVSLAADLQTGERVLRRLLVQQATRLRDAAELQAKDYGFKEALGQWLAHPDAATAETVKSALDNQGERIGARVVAYFDAQFQLVVATHPDAHALSAALREVAGEVTGNVAGNAAGKARDAVLTVRGGQAYQVVAVPVRTPAPVGWVLMAFTLDRAVLDDLKALSELDGVLLMRSSEAGWKPLAQTLDATRASPLSFGDEGVPQLSAIDGERVSSRFVTLINDGGQSAGVLLLRSLDAALAPYRQLQLVLLGLTLLGVAVFAVLSVLLARSISEPIKGLSQAARRLERGDYETPVSASPGVVEVRNLSIALENMREGIQRRDALVANLAYVDQLTLLPNRARLAELLQHHLLTPDSHGAVLMLNLDRFKRVNDVLGRELGDRLLQAVGKRLGQLCSAVHADLARLYGDEFVIVLEQVNARQASEAAFAILKDFERPLQIDDQTIDLGAGIGIALYPEHGHEVNLLLARAELAMDAAKQRQCGSLIYHAQLDVGSQESLSLLSELRQAVAAGELRLYLQPKVDLRGRKIVGAEALVRWQHPTRGLVPPMQFIPFAEQTGFVRQLTAWVLAETAAFSRRAMDAGHQLRLSVNLSTRDLLDQDLPAKIEALLTPLGVAPQTLCLEITESAIMDDPERALSTLEHLSAQGFKLSIDDFGTGYSSLAYLKRLPVDELKIDKSFVLAMERDLDDARIVRSTVELAHNLGLSVVAEGLETIKAWSLLAALGCNEGQGYFLAKPMPADQFLDWAQGWTAPSQLEESGESLLGWLG